jgi:hypothetical protein
MISFIPQVSLVVVNNHIPVETAAKISGYSHQYLRRLLRCSKLEGLKIGQVWLIDNTSFDGYLALASDAFDLRFGPK